MVVGLGILVGLGALLFGAARLEGIQDLIATTIARRMLEPRVVGLERNDALHVIVCGSGSPLPAPERSQACVLVFAGGHGYVFDTGMGSVENLATWRIPAERIDHVFLTHFHSDHIADLYELNLLGWVAGRSGPLRVHGPQGVETVVEGFQKAYSLDRGYRVAHHGDLLAPENGHIVAAPFDLGPKTWVVHEDGEVKISAFRVEHDPVEPAVGYRVDYRGRSVVISGDTVRSESLTEAARNVDLLLHEALAPHVVATLKRETEASGQPRLTKIMIDIPDYHTSPVEAAELANEANVRKLVLYHLAPAPPSFTGLAETVFLRGVPEVRPGVTLARDGSYYALPVGVETIDERTL